MVSHAIAATVAALTVALSLAACAPSPKYTSCSNDGDCKSERHRFCMQSRCVECVSRASCNGGACNAGVCEISCEDAGDCLHGDACVDGACKSSSG